jgi:hypothetical protein
MRLTLPGNTPGVAWEKRKKEEKGQIDNTPDFIKKALGNRNRLPHKVRADFGGLEPTVPELTQNAAI